MPPSSPRTLSLRFGIEVDLDFKSILHRRNFPRWAPDDGNGTPFWRHNTTIGSNSSSFGTPFGNNGTSTIKGGGGSSVNRKVSNAAIGGSIAGMVLVLGFLWYGWRRGCCRKRRIKLEQVKGRKLDSSDSSSQLLRTLPTPATHLAFAVPPPAYFPLEHGSDTEFNQKSAESRSQTAPPRYWQIQNSSSSASLHQELFSKQREDQEMVGGGGQRIQNMPSLGARGLMVDGEGHAFNGMEGIRINDLSAVSSADHGHTFNPHLPATIVDEIQPPISSLNRLTEPASLLSPTTIEAFPESPSESLEHSTLTRSMSLVQSPKFTLPIGLSSADSDAESEIRYLRRQVENLAQANAQLAGDYGLLNRRVSQTNSSVT